MTKNKIAAKCRGLLNQSNLSDSDMEFLKEVFLCHPNSKQKIGCGIKTIFVKKSEYGNNCFWIKRLDDSETDISYMKCLNKSNDIDSIKKACRTAIWPVIRDFKDSIDFTDFTCPFTGEIVTSKNVHIDHYDLKFSELFNVWIKNYELKDLIKAINVSKDGDTTVYFIDENIKNDFIKYHNDNTHLRAVSKKANLTILK